MRKMFSSPDTLLMMCIRNRDYATCREIIRFFGLEHNPTHASRNAQRSEQLAKITQKLDDDSHSMDFGEIGMQQLVRHCQ
jgi:hypothetical protein